jgi:hypothetical protein
MGKKDFEKIYGPTYENGHWRIKINSELEGKYKSQDIFCIKIWKIGMSWTRYRNE